MSFHYEIVFFKPKNICGKNIIHWSASGKTSKDGYSGFELINKLYKELEQCHFITAAEKGTK